MTPASMPFTPQQKKVFEALYDRAIVCDVEDAKIVQLFDGMIGVLVESGEADVMEMHSKMVGVHPENRGGKMMAVATMHKKGAKIV